jgi:hypothetical protein
MDIKALPLPLRSTPRRFLVTELRVSIWRSLPPIDAAPMLAARENGENSADFAQALLDASEARLKRLLRETDRLIVTRWC